MHGTIDLAEDPDQKAASDKAWSIPLDDIDVSQPELFRTDSFWPYFDRLRQEAPVHYCKDSMFGPYWSVTKYNDIMDIETNHSVFSSASSLGGITIRDVAPDSAPRKLHRDGPAAPLGAAQDRRADVHADASRPARDQHPQAVGRMPRQSACQRGVRLGRQGLDRTDHADARGAVRLPLGGPPQADALVRHRNDAARSRRPGRDRGSTAGRTAGMRDVFRKALEGAHQPAAEERPAVDDGAQRRHARHGSEEFPRQSDPADRRRQRHHPQHAVGQHLCAEQEPGSVQQAARQSRTDRQFRAGGDPLADAAGAYAPDRAARTSNSAASRSRKATRS